jgi:hypothetical protein
VTRQTGVVALEFKNPDGTFFAHGAVIDAYEDGRNPDVAYFIVNNSTLNDNWFFKAPGQLFDTRAFKRHLENFALPPTASARVFTFTCSTASVNSKIPSPLKLSKDLHSAR